MKLRLVDRILDYSPWASIRGTKAVSFEEYSAASATSAARELPRSLMLQSIMDLANWLAIVSSQFQTIALPLEWEQVSYASGLGPGERMLLHVRVRESTDGRIVIDGHGCVEQRQTIVVQSCVMGLAPLAAHYDAPDLRVLFGELQRPEGVRM